MYIGIDLGGTNIRAACIEQSEVKRKVEARCPAQASQDEVLHALYGVVDQLFTPQIKAIGAGIPSVLDREQGIVYHAANIPSWQEVHLKDALQQRYGVDTYLNNDANCFTLGVKRAGEGRPFSDLLGITLGTGVGAGVIVNGLLYNGCNTGAGEIGSLSYLESDFEHHCSSSFFTTHYHISAKDMATQARGGDARALQGWNAFGRHVGELIKAAMLTYDPQAIILGGSIAKAYDLFQDTMWQQINTFDYPASAQHLHVMPSQLNDAALIGAASLCEESHL